MERAEAKGLGFAVAGHFVLLAALTYSLRPTEDPPAPPPSVEVTFIEDVGVESASPTPAAQPPAPSAAPEVGPPEEAAPAPEPLPALPTPPPPVQPQPRQAAPPPRPQPTRAQPQPVPPAQRSAPSRPAPPAQQPPRPSAGQSADRSRGSRLNPDILKGIGSDPSPSRSPAAPAAIPGPARASINAAIRRALVPCERQPLPSPAAAAILVDVRVSLNRDGSLASAEVVRVRNENPDLRMYEQRMRDLALAIVRRCTPIRDLPAEYYDAPRGWRQFTYQFDPRQS